MFAVPVSTCTNVKRRKDNRPTSSIFYGIKTGDEKLQKTSLMKCQSQLASLQLIRKSWWQGRLPSLLNWQAPKEAHLPGITPPFRPSSELFGIAPKETSFSSSISFSGLSVQSENIKQQQHMYTHTETEPQILTLLCNRPVTCRYQAESCWQMMQNKPPKNLQVWRRNPVFSFYTALTHGSETHPKWEIIFFSHWLSIEDPFHKSLLCSSWMSGPANQNILL